MNQCRKCGSTEKNSSMRCKPCAYARGKKWQLENAEKEKERKKILYQQNAEEIKARSSEWAKNNPQRRAEILKRWQELNPDKCKESVLKYLTNNPEKRKQSCAKWESNNKEAVRIIRHNIRVKRRENGGKLSHGLAEKLYKLQRGKCACCGKPLGNDYHLDHKMPIALGGKNEDWNIQLLTATCNRRKSAKNPIKYMQEKGFLL